MELATAAAQRRSAFSSLFHPRRVSHHVRLRLPRGRAGQQQSAHDALAVALALVRFVIVPCHPCPTLRAPLTIPRCRSYTFLDSPTSEPATLTFDEPTPSPPVQPAPSRSQLVRRVLGIALLLCFVLGVSFRSVTINLRPSYASKPETSVVEPDPPVDDCLRDQLSACTWTLASREDDLITALGEISSAQKAGESLFWLGLGVCVPPAPLAQPAVTDPPGRALPETRG